MPSSPKGEVFIFNKLIIKYLSMKKVSLITLSMAVCFLATTSSRAMTANPKSKKTKSGVVTSNLDNSVKPSADFYQYACGGWMKLNPLQAEYSRYGSLDVLGENNQKQLKDLVTKIAAQKKTVPGSIEQKIGDLYNIGMDTLALEKQGAQPIQAELTSIAALNRKDISKKLAEMALEGLNPFFGLFGSADPDNSDMTMAYLWQTGLGIGDRDYYVEADQQKIRDEYVNLIAKMFRISDYSKLAGFAGQENEMAQRVLSMETMMAHFFMDKTTLRDPYKTVNKKSVADAQKLIPALELDTYLKTLNVNVDKVNVGQPDYFAGLNNILATADMAVMRGYMAWNVINAAAPYLSDDFVNADFDFYGKVLSGKQENRPRWKRVVSTVDGCLGEALGQMYVQTYFPAEAKARMEQLVKNLQWALGERIKSATWMTDVTKKAALEKLAAFTVKIGYPDKWRDYSALNVNKDSYYANVVRARRFENAYELAKIGKKVDKTEWLMTPQTVNAYYEPTSNEICFPAGILQKPYFDPDADDASNYGAIGVVIGHEMTHGFDDQGRSFDPDGNMNDWWTSEDADKFKE